MSLVDEGELVAKCARHGLSGLAEYELRQAGITVSQAAATALRRDAMSIAVVGIKVKKLLFQCLEALARDGIVPVLLKGYGLALRCYPDPLYRPMTDVDLLVGRDELHRAEAALAQIGLKKNEQLESFQLQHHHHLNFYGALDGHHLVQRAVEDSLEGRRVMYLRPEDELVYLATHATQHLFKGVAWLYDLKLFIRRYPDLDWQSVISVAEESGMQTPVYFALR